jgi:hypothetical protein
MQKINSDWKSASEAYYLCYYHILTVKHRNYHHVIMKMTPDEVESINTLDADDYQYRLISAQLLHVQEKHLTEPIIQALVMDGESLLKRFKAQHKNISSIHAN